MTTTEDVSKKIVRHYVGVVEIILYTFIFLCLYIAMTTVATFRAVKAIFGAMFMPASMGQCDACCAFTSV
ncbi:hypothetical protein AOQ84DRAFT_100506 [Glonium stellatum]|uniref:Uncharacterized protein n=1 Tax=Glonium stellatum TaxID=574774 RepID=A0A8E2EV90_9PEZI|nr:hypothetical protein AOQ84DRAFT_100506 [Glonium stellatum]